MGDFDDDGLDDLAVGVPGEDLLVDEADAGAVHVFYGQASTGLDDNREDFFVRTLGGGSVEAGAVVDTGAVYVFFSDLESIFADEFESGTPGGWSVVVD